MKLVFLHGLGQTNDSWDEVIKYFDAPNILRISLNTLVEDSKAVTFNDLSENLNKFLKIINEPFIVIGLSLGGCFALQQGLSEDIRLKGLVLSGTQYSMTNSRKIRLLFLIQKYIFRLSPQHIWKKQGLKKSKVVSLYNSMENFDLSNEIPYITIPTLVMVGSKDKANISASKDIVEKIPNAQFRMIEGGDHQLNTEKPEIFANMLNEFLLNINLEENGSTSS